MSLFWNTFYDKYGNFDNTKFISMLEETKKKRLKNSGKKSSNMNREIRLFESTSKKELWNFINKLSIFINSGIDIKWALAISVKQTKNPYLKRITQEIKDNINHGISIHETMMNYPKVFDTLTVSLIKVWEKTGKLGSILAELDTNMLENIELKGKVKWAMIYPMILLWLTFCMVIFMMIFIVPRITESFEKAGSELPALTQFVVAVSNFFIHDWEKLLIGFVWVIILFKLINMTYIWRFILATIAYKLPIFWYIVQQSNIVYFIKSFTILLDSWVLLLESLKTSSLVVPNLAYKKELVRIKNEVEVGLTISKALWLNLDYEENVYLNKMFSEEFAYVISTWEETGTLSNSLKKIWDNYNSELKRYIGNLSSSMEPIIIVIVGALVGTIVVAIMLPFFQMWQIAKDL